jgi:hypothetical protein
MRVVFYERIVVVIGRWIWLITPQIETVKFLIIKGKPVKNLLKIVVDSKLKS